MILFYVALKWNVLSSVTVSSHLLFCDVKSFEGKRLPRRALTICLIGIDVVVMTIVWYYAVKRLFWEHLLYKIGNKPSECHIIRLHEKFSPTPYQKISTLITI